MEKILKKFKRKSPIKTNVKDQSVVPKTQKNETPKKQAKGIKSNNFFLKVLLDGVHDEESHLSKLRGLPHILKYIWTDVKNYWQSHIILPGPVTDRRGFNVTSPPAGWNKTHPMLTPRASLSVTFAAPMGHIDNYNNDKGSRKYFEHCPILQYPEFPDPTGININMMPFICGHTFEDCKLPEILRPYSDLIEMCLKHQHSKKLDHELNYGFFGHCLGQSDLGKVYYLTVQENAVKSGQSQRRPGLHVDSPGWVKIKNDDDVKVSKKGSGSSRKYTNHYWGAGSCHVFNMGTKKSSWIGLEDIYRDNLYVTDGGIYIASNVPDSTRVWNCAVDGEVIGQHGDIEHLSSALGEGELMRPGQVYWITDKTPHESLPLKEKTMRQFFRIVTADVSFWFRDHSTVYTRSPGSDA